jgi:hypothetical protein
MAAEGRSFRLTEAKTFEDMIYATLVRQGDICCPGCGSSVAVK